MLFHISKMQKLSPQCKYGLLKAINTSVVLDLYRYMSSNVSNTLSSERDMAKFCLKPYMEVFSSPCTCGSSVLWEC